MKNLAPIVLFVYNRPDHTQKTLKALQNNTLASESELFIYSDDAKNDAAIESVNEVRQLIDNISGFKKITIIKQEKNKGLADSIISGVTEIVNRYGKIIVLEDDLVTSPYFLTFMNDSLNYYQDENKVWHLSGWNYPIDTKGLPDTFLWRTMNCWGWATWSDRWDYFEKNTDKLIESFTSNEIKAFNLDGYENFWGQILANKKGEINTWAVYWYATIFKNEGLCLNSTETYVDNIGLDGSGVHCGVNKAYLTNLSQEMSVNFESELGDNDIAIKRIQLFYKKMNKSFIVRVINKFTRLLIKKNIIK